MQSFEEFRKGFSLKRQILGPSPERQCLHLIALGPWSADSSLFSQLKQLCTAFFLPLRVVQLRSQMDLSEGCAVAVNADEVLQWLRSGLRRDSAMMLALTMAPLMTNGVATIGATDWDGRVGVFSFSGIGSTATQAGLPPQFGSETCSPERNTERAAKLLLHSAVHMFGVLHCCYYRCLMNGARTVEEADAMPPYLCGLCLKKLQLVLGFDVLDRYQQLAAAWAHAGADDVASWYRMRVALLRGSMTERLPRAWCIKARAAASEKTNVDPTGPLSKTKPNDDKASDSGSDLGELMDMLPGDKIDHRITLRSKLRAVAERRRVSLTKLSAVSSIASSLRESRRTSRGASVAQKGVRAVSVANGGEKMSLAEWRNRRKNVTISISDGTAEGRAYSTESSTG
jgi:predicted Zn-dependent protease